MGDLPTESLVEFDSPGAAIGLPVSGVKVYKVGGRLRENRVRRRQNAGREVGRAQDQRGRDVGSGDRCSPSVRFTN
jgi:hypothetical protein